MRVDLKVARRPRRVPAPWPRDSRRRARELPPRCRRSAGHRLRRRARGPRRHRLLLDERVRPDRSLRRARRPRPQLPRLGWLPRLQRAGARQQAPAAGGHGGRRRRRWHAGGDGDHGRAGAPGHDRRGCVPRRVHRRRRAVADGAVRSTSTWPRELFRDPVTTSSPGATPATTPTSAPTASGSPSAPSKTASSATCASGSAASSGSTTSSTTRSSPPSAATSAPRSRRSLATSGSPCWRPPTPASGPSTRCPSWSTIRTSRARGLIAEATHDREGTFRQLGTLLAGTDTGRRTFRAHDQGDTDTDELLAAAGLGADEIAALRAGGVVA